MAQLIDYASLNKTRRENWLKKTLSELPRGLRILDAGAGELQYKKFCEHLEYVSQDFAQYDGQGDKSGLQTGSFDNSKIDIISDITEIPEKDKSFDAIMCIEVFEHLPNPVEAIKEFSRLLRPGGHLIITAPFASLTHYAPYHFCTGFNKYFYEDNLKKFNFEIEEVTANGNYFEYLAQEIHRINYVRERYSDKIELGQNEWTAITNLIQLLEKLSSKDSGSDELLCFGYHVRATKK